MQQTRLLHRRFYHIGKIDETNYSQIVYDRKEKLEFFKKLISEGCSEKTALQAIQTSRATLCRWKKRYREAGLFGLENESRAPKKLRVPSWSSKIETIVYKIRKRFPLWGKYKIAAVIKRDYQLKISVSMVGRILKKLLLRGAIRATAFYYGRTEKKKRVFNKHAQRWKYGMRGKKPGELIQVDHMKIRLVPGEYLVHFKAVCPVTKVVVEQAYSRATSVTASNFLEYMQQQFPFDIQSIQVDGGSEFMGNFELACEQKKLPLFVLPPRSPKYNGCVERGNSTVKYEFYRLYNGPPTLKFVREKLKSFVDIYRTSAITERSLQI